MVSGGVDLACVAARMCHGIAGERTGVEEADAVIDGQHVVLLRLRHPGCAAPLGGGLRGCGEAEQDQCGVSRQG